MGFMEEPKVKYKPVVFPQGAPHSGACSLQKCNSSISLSSEYGRARRLKRLLHAFLPTSKLDALDREKEREEEKENVKREGRGERGPYGSRKGEAGGL